MMRVFEPGRIPYFHITADDQNRLICLSTGAETFVIVTPDPNNKYEAAVFFSDGEDAIYRGTFSQCNQFIIDIARAVNAQEIDAWGRKRDKHFFPVDALVKARDVFKGDTQ